MLSHYYFYSSVRYIQQQKRESTNVVYFHGSTSTVVKQTLTCYFLFFLSPTRAQCTQKSIKVLLELLSYQDMHEIAMQDAFSQKCQDSSGGTTLCFKSWIHSCKEAEYKKALI